MLHNTNTKDDYENNGMVLTYINDFLVELNIQQEQMMEKISLIELNMEDVKRQIEDISGKIDYNFEYFSTSQNKNSLEKEKLERQLDNLRKELKDYQAKEDNLQIKIDKTNYVKKYINVVNTKMIEFDNQNLTDQNFCSELVSLGVQILETQENERTRIARDLHDSTVQNLTNLVHKTELCLKLADIDTIRMKLELETIAKSIHTTINEMRSIIYDLRPMSIDDLGLSVTINRFITQFMVENDNIDVEFITKNDEVTLLPIISITLFRILQEACNNVIEHAQANKINIELVYYEKSIQLSICDDGIGFDYEQKADSTSKKDKSFGLSIMKERVYLLSGKIDIISRRNEGTKILVSVPI